jgi:hypothetical protein
MTVRLEFSLITVTLRTERVLLNASHFTAKKTQIAVSAQIVGEGIDMH